MSYSGDTGEMPVPTHILFVFQDKSYRLASITAKPPPNDGVLFEAVFWKDEDGAKKKLENLAVSHDTYKEVGPRCYPFAKYDIISPVGSPEAELLTLNPSRLKVGQEVNQKALSAKCTMDSGMCRSDRKRKSKQSLHVPRTTDQKARYAHAIPADSSAKMHESRWDVFDHHMCPLVGGDYCAAPLASAAHDASNPLSSMDATLLDQLNPPFATPWAHNYATMDGGSKFENFASVGGPCESSTPQALHRWACALEQPNISIQPSLQRCHSGSPDVLYRTTTSREQCHRTPAPAQRELFRRDGILRDCQNTAVTTSHRRSRRLSSDTLFRYFQNGPNYDKLNTNLDVSHDTSMSVDGSIADVGSTLDGFPCTSSFIRGISPGTEFDLGDDFCDVSYTLTPTLVASGDRMPSPPPALEVSQSRYNAGECFNWWDGHVKWLVSCIEQYWSVG